MDGEIPFYVGESTKYIPAFRLTKEEGEKLKAQIEQGSTSLTLDEINYIQTEGDHLADFSSRILLQQMMILSLILQRLVSLSFQQFLNILTTRKRVKTTLFPMSVCKEHLWLLLISLALRSNFTRTPDYSPFDVKASLMNTANDLKEKYSVYEVGAGRVDAYNAVRTETSFKVLDTTQTVVNDEVIEVPEETGSIAFGKFYQKDGEALEQNEI